MLIVGSGAVISNRFQLTTDGHREYAPMGLFVAPKLGSVEISALEEISKIRKQVKYVTARPRRWSVALRRMMLAAAVRGSNSIEGYKASIEDALAAVQQDEPFDAGGETWDALTSYRSAMTYVLQLADDVCLAVS